MLSAATEETTHASPRESKAPVPCAGAIAGRKRVGAAPVAAPVAASVAAAAVAAAIAALVGQWPLVHVLLEDGGKDGRPQRRRRLAEPPQPVVRLRERLGSRATAAQPRLLQQLLDG